MSNKRSGYAVDSVIDTGVNMSLRRIYLFGSLDNDMAERFAVAMDILSAAGPERINITMNCEGGSVYDGLSMVDAIRASRCTTDVLVTGQCLSMATAVLQAATYRRAMPNATFMVHDGSDTYTGHARNFEAWAADSKRLREIYYGLLATHSEHNAKFWARSCVVDKIFSATKALKLGLIDEVVDA